MYCLFKSLPNQLHCSVQAPPPFQSKRGKTKWAGPSVHRPVLAVQLRLLPHVLHDGVQQPSNHVAPQPVEQREQGLEQGPLQGGQTPRLHGAQDGPAPLRLHLAQGHHRLLQLQEELRGAGGERGVSTEALSGAARWSVLEGLCCHLQVGNGTD